jgi:hypothetical protein
MASASGPRHKGAGLGLPANRFMASPAGMALYARTERAFGLEWRLAKFLLIPGNTAILPLTCLVDHIVSK